MIESVRLVLVGEADYVPSGPSHSGAPRWEDHGSQREYEEAWRRWRALEREQRLTVAEGEAKLEALAWALERRRHRTNG